MYNLRKVVGCIPLQIETLDFEHLPEMIALEQ